MIFMKNVVICEIKKLNLAGSEFYVSDDFAKDSMKVRSEG